MSLPLYEMKLFLSLKKPKKLMGLKVYDDDDGKLANL